VVAKAFYPLGIARASKRKQDGIAAARYKRIRHREWHDATCRNQANRR
jgi:hypothetical protein